MSGIQPEIDLSHLRQLVVQGFVVGGGDNVDTAVMSLHLYNHSGAYKDSRRVENLEKVGILRLSRPVFEELMLQAADLLGSHVKFVEELSGASKVKRQPRPPKHGRRSKKK